MRFQLISAFFFFSLLGAGRSAAQTIPLSSTGPNDTITVPMVLYEGEYIMYSEMEPVWISTLPPEKFAKFMAEYTRLRNAVYVCYPYAVTAGNVINDVNKHMEGVTDRKDRKRYIKTREAELKKQFSDPLSNLSVYQGRVLMKLINRQTSNNCYDLIKEYKGGLNARMYQTVAFFFGSSLKQDYDVKSDANDRLIEGFVQELNTRWYGHPDNLVKTN